MTGNYFDIVEGKNVRKLNCTSSKMSSNCFKILEGVKNDRKFICQQIIKMSENYLAQVPNVGNDTTKVQKCQKIFWN